MATQIDKNRSLIGRIAGGSLVVAAALMATGCMKNRATAQIAYPDDVRERHPITLGTKVKTLDLFAMGGGIGERQTEDLAGFVAAYRREGRGPIIVQVPSGPGAGHDQAGAVNAVRRVLGPRGYQMSSYAAHSSQVAAPIRVSYHALKAAVPHGCGDWPDDLIMDNIKISGPNQTYWNFGCATQANLAAQVDDPLDFVRPRPEGRIDTGKRMEAIDKLRKGRDPSTQYRQEAVTINANVGGGR